KVAFNILVTILLLASLVRLALAAPELQSGDQNAGTGQGTGANQGAGQNSASSDCVQTYVVKRGDSLSAIAQRFLGNLFAYNLIFQATNAAVGTDGFTPIRNPNIIEPGQVLCIPASSVTGAGTAGGVVTGTTQVTVTGSGTASQTFTLTPEQGVLLVENRAGGDFVFDLTQPEPGSALVAPNHLQPFIVPAGRQGYMAHHPIGQFSIDPGQVQVNAGRITHLICFRDVCQLASLVQPSGQSQGQLAQRQVNPPVVAGERPPTIDNNNENNNDNDNGNGNGNSNDNNNNDNNNNNNDNNDNDNNNNNNNDNNNNNNDNNNNNNDNNANNNGNNNDNDKGSTK
ncbi:MAG TPA: LysM peptidoglycan-binding domain-containing protein, partial [Anaerolineae bacterium]|nr:LysM peptidoglycan-binding domain-containing protein [Anaerolineae bacterium]